MRTTVEITKTFFYIIELINTDPETGGTVLEPILMIGLLERVFES